MTDTGVRPGRPPAVLSAAGPSAARRAGRTRERRGLLLLTLAVLGIGAWSLTLGELHLGLAELWSAMRGRGNPTTVFVVQELRIPRVICSLGVGAALGVGGAIFQSLTRNPLATPDLLGVTSGAGCAVAVAVLGFGWGSGAALAPIAMGGALLATAFLYAFAWRRGISGQLLVLIGIGVAAITSAVTSYLLTTQPALETQRVLFWLTGSVSGARWSDARLAIAAIVLLTLSLPLLRRWMPVLELDDGTATALGVPVAAARMTVVALAAVLAALAVAVAGPIGFLGLVAAPVARGITGRAGFSAAGAGLAGAVIVLLGDLIGAHAFGELAVPVGVVADRGRRALPDVSAGPVGPHPWRSITMTTHSLQARNLTVGYGERLVLRQLELEIPAGEVTVIVGANASGKSTLLHALARLRRPRDGQVLLDGADIHRTPTAEVARIVGLLPQSPTAPEGLTVHDLISRGRYPRQGWIRRWSTADERAVSRALELTGTADLADRPVDQLSGGQRQRVWIALCLAQETDLLLLDEPTTFLDMAHQIDVLELLRDLNAGGVTIVMVLHELNQAARYADHLVAVKDGAIVAQGDPVSVLTEGMVQNVFGLAAQVMTDPVSGSPMVIPLGRYAPAG